MRYIMHARLSVRLYVCPLPSVNLKTENHTSFKLRGEFSYVVVTGRTILREGLKSCRGEPHFLV